MAREIYLALRIAGHYHWLAKPTAISYKWPAKALEFIDSGPPALLNNPRRIERVVFVSFLKHDMEVFDG
jgi:hypothetical protein